MKLVILGRQPYVDYFRLSMIEAAERHGTAVLYIALLPQRNEIQLVRGGEIIATHSYRGRLTPVIKQIATFAGKDALVLFHSSAYANAAKVLQLKWRFRKASFVFDVFDDYFYDAGGLKLAVFKVLDGVYKRICHATLVASKDLAARYPGAFHLDNASHLSPSASHGHRIPHRVAVISSFDQRLDTQWLETLAALMPEIQFDLYGWVHNEDTAMARELDRLVGACRNLSYIGRYRNSELTHILAGYLIGIIPYRTQHPLTRYINPEKIYHYLCAGMEVISTPIPQALKMQEYVHVCGEPKDAAQSIRLVLAGKNCKNSGDLHNHFNWTMRWHELHPFLETLL